MSNNPVNSIDPNGGQDQPGRIYDGNGKDVTNHYYNSKGEFIGWNLMTSDYDGSRARAELRVAAMRSGDAASSSGESYAWHVAREARSKRVHDYLLYKLAQISQTVTGQQKGPGEIEVELTINDKFDYFNGDYVKKPGYVVSNSQSAGNGAGYVNTQGGGNNAWLNNAGILNDVGDGFGFALGYTGKTKLGNNGKLYFEKPSGRTFNGN